MGIHGNATCVINYDGATGWLVGEENRGLPPMFVMMNEARIGVGVQGLAHGEAAYQNAAAFAKERLQGRALTGPKNPTARRPDPRPSGRAAHADGNPRHHRGRPARSWSGPPCTDEARHAPDEAVRQKGEDYMALLTPVLKAFLTDYGFTIAVDAMQVLGGPGLSPSMEPVPARRRITMIYEGTNGVQALDLVAASCRRTAAGR